MYSKRFDSDVEGFSDFSDVEGFRKKKDLEEGFSDVEVM